jgi:hypothetical protein
MANSYLNPGQLKRLQTLWGQYCRHALDVASASDRRARLAWASEQTGRRINSFSDLMGHEAKSLIDTLQFSMGIPETVPSRHIRNRDRAKAAGTEGRKRKPANAVTLVSANEISLIDELMSKLGWSQPQLAGWLRSTSSPLKGQSDPQIRTLADANRVIWALKGMLKARERREQKGATA